jgi:hypothetical protein
MAKKKTEGNIDNGDGNGGSVAKEETRRRLLEENNANNNMKSIAAIIFNISTIISCRGKTG